jgi:hypothetical protein
MSHCHFFLYAIHSSCRLPRSVSRKIILVISANTVVVFLGRTNWTSLFWCYVCGYKFRPLSLLQKNGFWTMKTTCSVIITKQPFGWWLVYSCCSHLEHRASAKRFVSLQFLNLRHSVGLLGRVIDPSQGFYITQTDIHASSGIGTHDPSVQCGHCDRQANQYQILRKSV